MHLTDEQLNEYLDNETMERASIEAHLSSCGECAARLTALLALFDEIESLPELELTRLIATRFTPTPNLLPQLPRWLTLTVTLQAALAVIAIVLATPYVKQLLEPYLHIYIAASLNDVLLSLQLNFLAWMQSLGSITLPKIPLHIFTLPTSFTPSILALSLLGMIVVWVLGNWWLLRRKTNSLA